MHIFKFPFSMLPLFASVDLYRACTGGSGLPLLIQSILPGGISCSWQSGPEFIRNGVRRKRCADPVSGGAGERLCYQAYRGRIYKVLRKFEPCWHPLPGWRDLLTKRYSLPQRQGRFPTRATGLAAKSMRSSTAREALLGWNPGRSVRRVG